MYSCNHMLCNCCIVITHSTAQKGFITNMNNNTIYFCSEKRFVKTKAFKTAINSSTNLVPKFSIPAESRNQNVQVLNCMPFCQHLYNDSTHLHPREIQAQYHHQATIALFKQFHHELQTQPILNWVLYFGMQCATHVLWRKV